MRRAHIVLGVVSMILTTRFTRAESADNGIVVGPPKQYPHRYLEEQAANLEAQLAEVRAVNGGTLAAQLGKLQGSQLRSLDLAASIEPLATPKVVSRLEANAEGELIPKFEETTREAATASAPTLAGTDLTNPLASSLGLSAGDLLAEQIQLQYQVFNLRMLQRRAVSDRYFDDGDKKQGARLQALLGFPISLQPQTSHKKAMAVVEITVEATGTNDKPPAVVALMPEEKTYNAVAISKKSTAFGGAAFSGVFKIGMSGKWKSENLYLYRDADTLAFERPTDSPTARTFGWQFRPVLGRTSIEAGTRHLFALLAFDALDEANSQVELRISARTYWVDYRTKPRLPRWNPWGAATPLANHSFKVLHSVALQEGLAPRVRTARAESIGGGNVLVKIEGANLFRGTRVHVGNREIGTAGSTLAHPSDERLEFVAPIKEVLEHEVRLTGAEFGFSTFVAVPGLEEKTGFRVKSFGAGGERKAGYRELFIEIENPKDASQLPDPLDRAAYVTIGDEVYELDPGRWEERSECTSRWREATLDVPLKLFESDRELTVQVPFLGERFRSSGYFHPPVEALRVVNLESGDPIVWGIVGHGFVGEDFLKEVRVFAGREHTVDNKTLAADNAGRLLRLELPAKELVDVKEVIVTFPGQFEPTVLTAPGVSVPLAKPSVSNKPTVALNSSAGITFTGEGLKQIQKVTFEGKELPFQAPSNEKLIVYPTRDFTKQGGPAALLAHEASGRFIALEVVVQ